MSPKTIPLSLALQFTPTGVVVLMQNRTDQPVRIWEPANPWGGASWSLHLALADGSEAPVLRPNKQPYTANLLHRGACERPGPSPAVARRARLDFW